jgi:hypothetical protein
MFEEMRFHEFRRSRGTIYSHCTGCTALQL